MKIKNKTQAGQGYKVSNRQTSYDLMRAVLVIGMIIYHIRANFPQLQTISIPAFSPTPLRDRVPVGFMVFLGVVISQFLTNKKNKLLSLALQLWGIYIITNLANIRQLIQTETFQENFFYRCFQFFIIGNQSHFSLEILRPMTMLLVIWAVWWTKINHYKKFRRIPLATLLIFEAGDFYSFVIMMLVRGIRGTLISHHLTTRTQTYQKIAPLSFVITSLILWQTNHSTPAMSLLIALQIAGLYGTLVAIEPKIQTHLHKKLLWIGRQSLWIYIGHIIIIKGLVLALR